jgi:hypothetical protein
MAILLNVMEFGRFTFFSSIQLSLSEIADVGNPFMKESKTFVLTPPIYNYRPQGMGSQLRRLHKART